MRGGASGLRDCGMGIKGRRLANHLLKFAECLLRLSHVRGILSELVPAPSTLSPKPCVNARPCRPNMPKPTAPGVVLAKNHNPAVRHIHRSIGREDRPPRNEILSKGSGLTG